MPPHLNQSLKKLVGVSLAEANPALYERIEKMWKLRGDLAHSGNPSVSDAELIDLIRAAEACAAWLQDLKI